MSNLSAAEWGDLIRESGEGWILGGFKSESEAVDRVRHVVGAASTEYQVRFAARVDSVVPALSDDSIRSQWQINPLRVQAFVQCIAKSSRPEMLVMVWRILMGDVIESVDMRYERANSFALAVSLQPQDGQVPDQYTSDDIRDAALVRHFGIARVNDRPLFDGFFALRRP